jgi:protein SCO1/2
MAGIFVSVDTERDTPRVTQDYASHFGEGMIGLGGNIEQINAAAKNFKVSYAVTKTQDNYTVQHTANVFLIDPDGALVDVFNFSTKPEVLLKAIH